MQNGSSAQSSERLNAWLGSSTWYKKEVSDYCGLYQFAYSMWRYCDTYDGELIKKECEEIVLGHQPCFGRKELDRYLTDFTSTISEILPFLDFVESAHLRLTRRKRKARDSALRAIVRRSQATTQTQPIRSNRDPLRRIDRRDFVMGMSLPQIAKL